MYLAKTKGNLNPRGEQPQSNLQVSTVRSFEGGLNVTDTDLNMSPKYAKVLDNIERSIDGSLAVRHGTVMITELPDPTNIVNCFYFNDTVISVMESGAIYQTHGTGFSIYMEITPLGGNPWPAGVTLANFTIFKSDLIIVNGRDKPLIIGGVAGLPTFLQIDFLADKGGATNVNTPIAKYVIAHGRFTCMAGLLDKSPSLISISMQDTSGTYVDDIGVDNNALEFDVGSRVSLGSSTITGMVAYRDKLLVTFERGVLPVNLGIFKEPVGDAAAVHAPTDDGFIEEFGCLTHRSLMSVGDDTYYCDNVGVTSINRVNVFNTLRPLRASHLVDPLITSLIQPLSQAQIAQYVFAVYDLRNFRYMLFVPRYEGETLVETICFSYMHIPALKIQAWARLRGWKWQGACRTALQNIIFAGANKLYAYDFDRPDDAIDFRNDPDVNAGGGTFVDFEWELPWADFKHRMDIKQLRYIALDTQGKGTFTVEGYVDNLVFDKGVRVPMLSMNFSGGDTGGYGNAPYGNSPYGSGKRTKEERLFAWTTKLKLFKLRLFGRTRHRLKFISISVAYIHGGIRR